MSYKSSLRYAKAYCDPENKSDLDRYIRLLKEKNLVNDSHSTKFIKNCLMFSAALVDTYLFKDDEKIYEEALEQRRYYQKLITFNEDNWRIVKKNIQDLLNALINEDRANADDYKKLFEECVSYINELYSFYIAPRYGLLVNYFDPDNTHELSCTAYKYAKQIADNKELLEKLYAFMKKDYHFDKPIEEYKQIILFSGALLDEISKVGWKSQEKRLNAQQQIWFESKYLKTYQEAIRDIVSLLVHQDIKYGDEYNDLFEIAKEFVAKLSED